MTSRERFKLAINHQEPDRIPIDVGGDLHNGLHEVAYRNLLRLLGESDDIQYYDYMQHLAVCKTSVLERLHTDTRYIFANSGGKYLRKVESDTSWLDEWGVRRKNYGLYDESVGWPLEKCSLQDVRNYRVPDAKDPARYSGLREKAKQLFENTDYALIAGSPGTLFFLSSELIGFQKYMEAIILEPKIIETLVDKILDYFITFFRHYLQQIGDYVEMVWLGDDWGTQLGPIMNPGIFRELFVTRYKKLTTAIKEASDVKIALHSCGSIYYALQDFVDAGIDVIHPLQGDAAEMQGQRIKDDFGKKLVVYSNISNQLILPNGSPEDVVRETKEKIKIWGPGGGYIMSGGHNFQADVPPENILALIDTCLKYGNYPIGFSEI